MVASGTGYPGLPDLRLGLVPGRGRARADRRSVVIGLGVGVLFGVIEAGFFVQAASSSLRPYGSFFRHMADREGLHPSAIARLRDESRFR